MTQCKSCGAPILWVTSSKGKKMPLDADPERRFILQYEPGAEVQTARSVHTYQSHFATCPDADKHRSSQ